MTTFQQFRQSTDRHSYNPSVGTTQVGHRAISGDITSTGEHIHLRAWALVYPLCILADGFSSNSSPR